MMESIFSGHDRIKLEINNMEKFVKFTNRRKINNTLPNNQGVKEEIKGKS